MDSATERRKHAEAVIEAASSIDRAMATALDAGIDLHIAIAGKQRKIVIMLSDTEEMYTLQKPYDGDALIIVDAMILDITSAYAMYKIYGYWPTHILRTQKG